VLFPTDEVKLPSASFGTNGKYAAALFRASVKGSDMKTVTSDMTSLLDTISKDDKLDTFFKLTSVGKEEKAKVLNQVTGKMSPIVQGFVLTLAENGRLGHLRNIFSQFQELAAAHSGVFQATVKSAEPLGDADKKRLQSALNAKAGKGKSVDISYVIDTEIKGGLVVDLGDQWMDLSLSSQIRKASSSIASQINAAYTEYKGNVESAALSKANLTAEQKSTHENLPLKTDHFAQTLTEEGVAKYNKLANDIIAKRERVISTGGFGSKYGV
jgi:F-type H+-transporting ATPase subunit O